MTSGNVPEIGDPALVDYAGDQANARRELQARIDAALELCDRGFVSPYATTGFLHDLRTTLLGNTEGTSP